MALRPAAGGIAVISFRVREPALRDRRPPRPTTRRPPRKSALPPATVMQRWLDLSA
jgi:hypothetical protein